MSFNSNNIEVKRFFPAHPDGILSKPPVLPLNSEDRNVLDGSKGYVKAINPEPEKKDDMSAPVKLSDESMNIQSVGYFFGFCGNS